MVYMKLFNLDVDSQGQVSSNKQSYKL